ncbi:MAG: hypothetical protein ACLQT7_10005 [Candidatus Dormibacteria bacterium]
MTLRLDPLAEADLDRVPRPDFARVRQALADLERGAEGLDVGPLEARFRLDATEVQDSGSGVAGGSTAPDEPWQVLVVDGHWIVFRLLLTGDQYVARIVTRRELARIVRDLP